MARILVVDDVMAERLHVCEILRKDGHEIVTAENGARGVEAAVLYQPDLIIMDLVMPVKDGYAACNELRATPETRDIPVIVVSSKSDESDIFRATHLGARNYLVKPVAADALRAALARLI